MHHKGMSDIAKIILIVAGFLIVTLAIVGLIVLLRQGEQQGLECFKQILSGASEGCKVFGD